MERWFNVWVSKEKNDIAKVERSLVFNSLMTLKRIIDGDLKSIITNCKVKDKSSYKLVENHYWHGDTIDEIMYDYELKIDRTECALKWLLNSSVRSERMIKEIPFFISKDLIEVVRREYLDIINN